MKLIACSLQLTAFGQTDTDVVLEEPEYQEKLDRIVQRYLERLEPEPEPEPEPERTSQADEETRRSQGAEDTSAHATSSSDVSSRTSQAEGAVGEPSSPTQDPRSGETPDDGFSSGLIWQPGDPMINATEIVETSDGEVFLVPPAEKQEFLRLLRCGKSVK